MTKQNSVLEGVLIAVGLSIVSFVLLAFGTMRFFDLNLAVATASALYISYLLARGPRKEGRLAIAVFSVLALSITASLLPFFLSAVASALVIWLARAFIYSKGALGSFFDLTLVGGSGVIAMIVLFASGSFLLSFWTFFLAQALHVFIPRRFSLIPDGENFPKVKITRNRFATAHHAAESALADFVRG